MITFVKYSIKIDINTQVWARGPTYGIIKIGAIERKNLVAIFFSKIAVMLVAKNKQKSMVGFQQKRMSKILLSKMLSKIL